MQAEGLGGAHIVGWSLGGGVVLQYLLDAPGPPASVTLVDPVSPYGFGGTRGEAGELCSPDGAGSGGGAANPEFVERLRAGDRGDESPLSPRQVLLAHYVHPPHVPPELDILVESMLSTRVGDDHYPGTSTTTSSWPGIAPGDRGVLNTLARSAFASTASPPCSPSHRSCGSGAPTTSSSRTPPSTTSPSSAPSAPCPAGLAPTPGPRNR